MLKFYFFLLFFVTVQAVNNYEQEERIKELRESKDYMLTAVNLAPDAAEARFGGQSQTTAWTAVVLVYHVPTSKGVGPGIIINTKWALCSTEILPAGVTKDDVRMYFNVIGSDSASISAGKKIKVKQLIVHPEVNGAENSLMLLRACPDFTVPGANLPAAGTTYPEGKSGGFLNFAPNLQFAGKNVGEACECEAFDGTKQICMQQNDMSYSAANEKGSALFIDNNISGFLVAPSRDTGEKYLDLTAYLDWINQNAD